MRITKFLHSCLLIEDQGNAVLIDPGNYTYEADILNSGQIEKLDHILITHQHQDHMDVRLLKQLIDWFPNVQIIGNAAVAGILREESIDVATTVPEYIATEEIPHENIFGREPQNSLFHIFNLLTHPGDSLHIPKTREILALPIQAPWGSMVAAIEKAAELKPKLVIPIHDWHWRDEARERLYAMARDYLKEQGVEFRGIETGETIEV